MADRILVLYRSILRIHRSKLPTPMRQLGDRYVREEFKAHASPKTTPEQWQTFLDEWQRYRDMLAGAADLGPNGTLRPEGESLVTGIETSGDIAPDVEAGLSSEQQERLLKLREEAVKLGKSLPEGLN